MNKLKKSFGQDDDTRSLLKNLHKKVYSICRLFTDNYAAHQSLFTDIIGAAAQNLRVNRRQEDKQTLFLRACINMAALHSITDSLSQPPDGKMQFKSPDYQKSMTQFREIVGNARDYEKILIFLNFEKWPADRTEDLSGLSPVTNRSAVHPALQKNRPYFNPVPKGQMPAQKEINPTPNLKDKLIWI
jgi:hypothetical protein